MQPVIQKASVYFSLLFPMYSRKLKEEVNEPIPQQQVPCPNRTLIYKRVLILPLRDVEKYEELNAGNNIE